MSPEEVQWINCAADTTIVSSTRPGDLPPPLSDSPAYGPGCAISLLIVFGGVAVIAYYDLIGTTSGRFPYVHNSWTRDAIGYLPGALVVEAVIVTALLVWSVVSRRWLPLVLGVVALGIVTLAADIFFHGIPAF